MSDLVDFSLDKLSASREEGLGRCLCCLGGSSQSFGSNLTPAREIAVKMHHQGASAMNLAMSHTQSHAFCIDLTAVLHWVRPRDMTSGDLSPCCACLAEQDHLCSLAVSQHVTVVVLLWHSWLILLLGGGHTAGAGQQTGRKAWQCIDCAWLLKCHLQRELCAAAHCW